MLLDFCSVNTSYGQTKKLVNSALSRYECTTTIQKLKPYLFLRNQNKQSLTKILEHSINKYNTV